MVMGFTSIRIGPGFHVLLAAFLFLGHGAVPAAGSEAGAEGLLDGKVFVVEKSGKGKKADGKDTYIFSGGTFRSANLEKWQAFVEGAYTAVQEGDTITFVADTRSKSHGKIHWEGTVKDGVIDVRYTWTGRKPKWYQSSAKPTDHWARSITARATEDPGPPGGGPPSHLLDGKIFFGLHKKKGEEADHPEYLVFRDGMFFSSGCLEFKFPPSSYSTDAEGGEIRFRAEIVSAKYGNMLWEGTLRDDVMEATSQWTHKRWYWSIERNFLYRGRLLE
jgi:hypothetical protein